MLGRIFRSGVPGLEAWLGSPQIRQERGAGSVGLERGIQPVPDLFERTGSTRLGHPDEPAWPDWVESGRVGPG